MTAALLPEEDTNLGAILLRFDVISEAQLQQAVLRQRACPEDGHMKLGEILVAAEAITDSMLSHALEVQKAERAGDVIGLLATLDRFNAEVLVQTKRLRKALDDHEEASR